MSDAANAPEPADAQVRRVAVATPSCPQAGAWIAAQLVLGPALACVALDTHHGLPETFAGRLDALVWCVDVAAARADDLHRAVAVTRPRRIFVLVVPTGFAPGDPPCAEPPPPLGGVWASLVAAAADRPVVLTSAGWSGEPLAEALQVLAGRLLRDPPGGEHLP